MNLFRRATLVAAAVVVASCQNSSEPNWAPAGSYVLESVSGRGPSTGTIVFVPGSPVTRSVRYKQADGSLSSEYTAVGTYRLTHAQGIELNLRENNGRSIYVWKVDGTLADGVLSIDYPDPADGWISERYRRR